MNAFRISLSGARSARVTGHSLLALVAVATGGCATTGSTLGSGVGDALLDRPPYYAGATLSERGERLPRLGHLAVAYQRGAAQDAIFDPARSPALDALLAEMSTFLDTLDVSVSLVAGRTGAPMTHAPTGTPPDVRFGCDTEFGVPGGDCVERGDSALGRGPQYMTLSVGRPSAEWVDQVAVIMDDHGVTHTLVITLEVGQHWTRQRGLRGSKEVLLGTDHAQDLPWLTSLETPVSVLQLTGALVGRDGRAVRIGAEGLWARPTDLTLSAAGAQELITDDDVRRLSTARRDDLSHRPPVWAVALRTLVEQLVGA